MTSTQPGVPPDAETPQRAQEGAQKGTKPNWWRRLFIAAVILFVIAFFAVILWQRHYAPANYNLAPQRAVAVAEAASAPASAASAAAPANEAAAPAEEATTAAVESKTYTVKVNDTLGKRFGKNWKAVCDLNAELLKKNCNYLGIGWVLNLPEGVEPLEDEALPAKKVTKVAAKPVVLPKTNAAGEILYRVVGTAPLNGCGKRDIADISREAWNVLGLSEEDQAWLQLNADLKAGPRINITADEGLVRILPDTRLEQVTFCRNGKVVAMGPMRTAWDADTAVYGERFVLPSGKVLVWMRNCFNWVLLPEEAPKLVPPPPPAPLPTVEPEPPIEVPPLLVPAPVPPATVSDKGVCAWIDPNAAIGQEREESHNDGDVTHSNFATVSLYCMRPFEAADGATGSHGFGGKVTASDWRGRVNHREGHFSGWNAMGGPSYKRVMDEGYDWEVSLAAGHQRDRFNQGQYASQRDFNLVGMTAGYNDYRRRLAGEEWLPEKQFFGALTLPVSRNVSHSWDGQPIADTEELSRFRFGVQAGYRQWLHETSDSVVLPYFQAGIFVQDPTSSSLSLRLGVSDPARIVGVGAGIDQDLQNGGHPVFAWGWWADPIQGFRVGRAKYRKHQVITDAAKRGITVEEKDGYIQSIRFSQEWLNSQGLKMVPTTPTTVTE